MQRKFSFGQIVLAVVATAFNLTACQKQFIEQDKDATKQKLLQKQSQLSSIGQRYCWEDAENPLVADSVLKPTLLGARLIGLPYSVANMQQAAINLTGTAAGIVENQWYIRLKPTYFEQLSALEALDIDLFDYPLDYELVQEGDFYNDSTTPVEQIPWLYAVVEPNFTPPSGVVFELLQRIHVPNHYLLEQEAFRITGNSVDTTGCGGALNIELGSTDGCDCELRPSALSCECRRTCGFSDRPCLNPLPPPPPVRRPGGQITVTDDVRNINVPVRNARMIARRFLKVDRTFTNNTGNYNFTKSFSNKVPVIVKFKNNQAKISGVRGIRTWQGVSAVKVNFGKFRGNINNLTHNVDDNDDETSRGARHWAAATTHNAVQEFSFDHAPAAGIGLPPTQLNILLTNFTGSGAAPLFGKRNIASAPVHFVVQTIFGNQPAVPGLAEQIAAPLVGNMDVMIGYNTGNVSSNNNAMAELCYHELAHTAHYNKVGNAWWSDFVLAEIAEMLVNVGQPTLPYGAGNTNNSPIIALGESWAYHIGHIFANAKYGINNVFAFEQNFFYWNNFITNVNGNILAVVNLPAHLNLLEDFSPLRGNDDPFWWIPQGLYYDLIDNRNDQIAMPARVNLNDVVSGFNDQQFFNALDADITTLPNYRIRLLNETGSNQTANVTTIFNFYGY